ncbi:nucleotide-binding protein [Nocardia halotolerans]
MPDDASQANLGSSAPQRQQADGSSAPLHQQAGGASAPQNQQAGGASAQQTHQAGGTSAQQYQQAGGTDAQPYPGPNSGYPQQPPQVGGPPAQQYLGPDGLPVRQQFDGAAPQQFHPDGTPQHAQFNSAPAAQPPNGTAPQHLQQPDGPQAPQFQQPGGQAPHFQPPDGPLAPQFQQPGVPPAQFQQPAPAYGQPGWGGQGYQPPSLDNVPVKRAKKAPGSGWRKAVHHVSGGAINPGMSAEERRLQELVARIRQPVRGDYRIAVLSLKGGVGKTTTTTGLGSIFASIRGDRVIAVDANPDFGTLSQRVAIQTRSTVRDLLLDPSIERYSDVRRHTSQSSSRLEVLASERDPAASESFNDEEYRAVARILQRFYNIILTDCGTGLMHSAMSGVLDLAHSLVLISSAAIDGARSAAATLDWLSLHGHDHLVRNAVVVINLPREGSPNVGVQQLREYFLSRCRAVHIIPFDEHLSEGAEIDLHRLHKTTKRAYVELAATVADEFGAEHQRFR